MKLLIFALVVFGTVIAHKQKPSSGEVHILPEAFKGHIDGFGKAVGEALANENLSYTDLEELLKKLKGEHEDLLEEARPTGRPGGKPSKNGYEVYKDAKEALENAYKEAEKKAKQLKEQLKEMEEQKMVEAYKVHVDGFTQTFEKALAGEQLSYEDLKELLKKLKEEHEDLLEEARPTGRPGGKPSKNGYEAYKDAKKALENAYKEAEEKAKQLKEQLKKLEEQKMVEAYKVHVDGFTQTFEKTLAGEQLSYEDLKELLKKLKEEHEDLLEEARPTGRPGGKPSKKGDEAYKDAKEALENAYKEAEKKAKQLKEQLKKMEEQKMVEAYKVHIDGFTQAFEKVLAANQLNYKDLEKILKKLKEEHKDLLQDTRPTGRPGGKPTKDEEKAFKTADHMLNKSYKEAKDRLEAWKKQMEKLEK